MYYFLSASAVNLEGELFKDLMKGYNKNVRPTEKSGDITPVYIKMTLTNLISLVGELHSTGLYDMMPISAETLKFHGPLDNVSLE